MKSTEVMSVDLLSTFRRVLIIAAHPDDEALGCGATIRSLAETGADVRAIFFTNGVGARSSAHGAQDRAEACSRAALELGISEFTIHDFPDNRLDTVALLDLTKLVESKIDEFGPQLAMTHSVADLNVDHRVAREATVTATRPTSTQSVRMVLSFEIPSSTEWGSRQSFYPSLFRDVTATWSAKVAALEHYREELRAPPHPRSLEAICALAQWRGSTIGVEYGEAFEIVRLVDRPSGGWCPSE